MVWADWRYNEELGQWETIIHCTSEELQKAVKQLRRRKIPYTVKNKHIVVYKYITAHKLVKILGLEVEY